MRNVAEPFRDKEVRKWVIKRMHLWFEDVNGREVWWNSIVHATWFDTKKLAADRCDKINKKLYS